MTKYSYLAYQINESCFTEHDFHFPSALTHKIYPYGTQFTYVCHN